MVYFIHLLFNVYMDAVMKEVKMDGDCLTSCMQMTWFYMELRKRPLGNCRTFCGDVQKRSESQ